MAFQKPKGTEDFFPEEFAYRQMIFDSFRKTAKRFNFLEVSSPAFENIGLLTEKEGDEIKSQIFTLDKRSDEEFGLRFDLTVPITRMFIERQKSIQKPAKWYAIDRMWRYEKPQKGRLREFYQISCEVFGSKTADCDREVVMLAIALLRDLGLTKDDFFVKVNSRVLLESVARKFVDKEKIHDVFRIIDKRAKITVEEFEKELTDLGVSDVSELTKILDYSLEELSAVELNDVGREALEKIQYMAKGNEDFIRFDLSIARGLAYYTGIVFEIFDTKEKYRALCGGGRYDGMVEMFGGQDCPGTGFAIGLSTLTLLLKDKGKLPQLNIGPDYFVAYVNKDVREEAYEIVDRLRKKYSVEFDLNNRNLGNQFKYAEYLGAKKVVVIGPDELKQGKVKVKDMKSGDEELVEIDSI